MRSWLLRNGVEPLRAFKEGSPRLNHRRSLMESQWLSTGGLRDWQLERLSEILAHAVETVPHYRDYPRRIDSLKQLESLPILGKRDVLSAGDSLRSVIHPPSKCIRKRTSGSTGEPLEILLDRSGLAWKHAATRRADEWTGWRFGQPVAKLWGRPDYLKEGFRGRLRNILFDRGIHLNTLEMGHDRIEAFLDAWNRRRGALLFGHAHSLYLLALYAKKRKKGLRHAAGIISTAMPLFDVQRKAVEVIFGRRVTNRYGCEEASLLACECELGGMHASSETNLVEIVEGRVVVTDLVNRAMPLIRYAVGDRSEWAAEPCKCGRGLPVLKKIEGREADFILTAEGRLISGISLTEGFILNLPGVTQVQIVQTTRRDIRLRLVMAEEGGRHLLETRARKLGRDLFGWTTTLHIEFVDTILPDATGKVRYCISHVGEDAVRSMAA